MKNYFSTLCAGVALTFLASCGGQQGEVKPYNEGINIIPMPQNLVQNQGVFKLSSGTSFGATTDEAKTVAEFFAAKMRSATGYNISVSDKGDITLTLDAALDVNDEGYTLDVTSEGVTVKAKTPQGLFYGMQSFMQLLPAEIESAEKASGIAWQAPAVSIKDEPRFGYRGVMLDVCRHFIPVEDIKKQIDVMSLFKINRLHWHLTEDQGWRIEIKKYPKLTEIGSKRKCTIKDWETKELDSIPVSGYYTQEEAKEIVRYAAERYITVIPEIDMPGHMLAALASYPELGCTGGPYEVATTFGVFRNVLCGGNEKTLQFAKDVINEIMDIFPSPYIHIGGDECPKYHWKTCAKCQKKIRELGLKASKEHTKENQLQAWFMGEVEKEIHKRGREMMAWDEILAGNPAKSTIVMAWTTPEARLKSIESGYRTIACPISNLYFSNPKYNKLKGLSSIERVYSFEPVPEEATSEQKKNLFGAQACIWTEWTKDSVKMEWQMMPRIAALAEIQWTEPANKNIQDFLKRLKHQLDIYELYGYNYKEDIHEALDK